MFFVCHMCTSVYDIFLVIQESAKQTADNAYKQYIKSRPPSSLESLKRAKILSKVDPKMHPMFGQCYLQLIFNMPSDPIIWHS